MRIKLIFFISLLMFAFVSRSQTFGLKGGVNIASMNFSASGLDISPKSILGIHIGPVAEFELQESLFFNTGILYSLKGYKLKMDFMGESMDEKIRINNLEIPFNFAYKFSPNETLNFFAQAGPYIGYALSGTAKTDGESEKIDFKEDGMKRFDFGLGIGLGMEFGPIVPSISYQFGLANLSDEDEVKVKNNVFQISVAYMFGK